MGCTPEHACVYSFGTTFFLFFSEFFMAWRFGPGSIRTIGSRQDPTEYTPRLKKDVWHDDILHWRLWHLASLLNPQEGLKSRYIFHLAREFPSRGAFLMHNSSNVLGALPVVFLFPLGANTLRFLEEMDRKTDAIVGWCGNDS